MLHRTNATLFPVLGCNAHPQKMLTLLLWLRLAELQFRTKATHKQHYPTLLIHIALYTRCAVCTSSVTILIIITESFSQEPFVEEPNCL